MVRQFADTRGLVEALRRDPPDVVVLDNQMPGGDGLTVLPDLRRACPRARILMWSNDEEVRGPAMEAGADGFVPKDLPLDVVAEAALEGAPSD